MAAQHKQWALVTGGNRGLGYEVCRKLLALGKPVILTARTAESGAKAAGQLRAAAPTGAKLEVLQLDVSSPESIKALGAAVGAKYDGQIDLLVNNAGVYFKTYDADSHARTLNTNLDGAVGVALALLPHLAHGARIVNVSSGLGKLGMLSPDYAGPITAAGTLEEVKKAAHFFDPASALTTVNQMAPSYSVSKAALNRVTQLLAADEALRARGISVVAVCPGWCATDMGNSADVPGGAAPPRSAGQGADSILLAADADAVANGSFTRDGETEEWGDAPAVPPPVEVGASA